MFPFHVFKKQPVRKNKKKIRIGKNKNKIKKTKNKRKRGRDGKVYKGYFLAIEQQHKRKELPRIQTDEHTLPTVRQKFSQNKQKK